MSWLALIAGAIFEGFAGLLAITILYLIWTGKISLAKLISENNGDASLSRLQFLIFTFVISLTLFLVSVGGATPQFPSKIPPEIFALLGISASSYLVSKGIQFSSPAGIAKPALAISPTSASSATPGPVTLAASLVNAAPGSALPALTWSLDAPAHGTLAPQPPGNAIFTPAPDITMGTVVTIRVQTNGYDDGTSVYTY